MKYVLGSIASALMIWCLLDKENQEYKVYVQVVALFLFFYVMMRLMNKTPSKNQKVERKDNLNKNDEHERMD